MRTTVINFTPKGTRGEFQRNWRNKTNFTCLFMQHFICIWKWNCFASILVAILQWLKIKWMTWLDWIEFICWNGRSVGKTKYCCGKFQIHISFFFSVTRNSVFHHVPHTGKILDTVAITNSDTSFVFNVHDTKWNKTYWHTVCASPNGHGTSCFLNLLDQSL